jgi:hypothetical protein
MEGDGRQRNGDRPAQPIGRPTRPTRRPPQPPPRRRRHHRHGRHHCHHHRGHRHYNHHHRHHRTPVCASVLVKGCPPGKFSTVPRHQTITRFPLLYQYIYIYICHINNRTSTNLQKSPSSRAGVPRFGFIVTNSVIKDPKSTLEMAIQPF